MGLQVKTVLIIGGDGPVVARRARLRDRLAARLRARRLVRRLASGAPPEASAPLALLAERLTEPERRSSIARELRRIVREAKEGHRAAVGRVMPSRARVRAAGDELARLADMLEAPGPVTAGAVAQAWMLLTDGTGPLYNPYSRTALAAAVGRAARDLRPWPA